MIRTKAAQYSITNASYSKRGVASIEFAVLLPVFIILVLGVVEFGLYFVKDEIVNSAVSNITLTLQREPHYYDTMTTAQKNTLIKGYGSSLVTFSPIGSNTGNYICVDTYQTQAAAELAQPCTNTHLNTLSPFANPSTPYYISVRSDLKQGTVTPLQNFIPMTKQIQVGQSSGTVQVNAGIPVTCDKPGQVLTSDGTNYICDQILMPNCSEPWQKLIYNGSAWVCTNIPYVVAGGRAHVTNGNGTWISDVSNGFWDPTVSQWTVTAGTHWNFIICELGVKFSIPTGLPPGHLITQGNLIYPTNGGSGNGNWHAWTVSFRNVNTPISGGTGSADVCMDNGGNYGNGPSGNEYVSWTITFIPN